MRLIRKLIIPLLFGVIMLPCAAQTTNAKSWQEAVIELRKNIKDGKIEGVAPLFTGIKRFQEDPEPINYNLTGVDQFLIRFSDAGDGNSWDHMVLGDPILTDIEGNKISLLELQVVESFGEESSPKYNENIKGGPLTINGKHYEVGACVHAEGYMLYELDGKYTNLEVEVGIDGIGREVSSAIYSFSDSRLDPQTLIKGLKPEFAKLINDFLYSANISPADFVFQLLGEDVEKRAAETILSKKATPNKEYYKAKVAEYDALTGDARVFAYMDLVQECISP